MPLPPGAHPNHAEAALVIRPESLSLRGGSRTGLLGRVVETVYAGADTRVLIRLPSGAVMTARHAGEETDFSIGAEVEVAWAPECAALLPA